MVTWSIASSRAFTLVVATIMVAAMVMQSDLAWAENAHPGQVLERGSRSAMKAHAKAWASGKRTEIRGQCPTYKKLLDSRESDSNDGRFVVKVPSNERVYSMVYCETGYHHLIYPDILNERNGKPVNPIPVYMRKQSRTNEEKKEEFQEIRDRTVRLTVYFMGELANMQRMNPGAVDSALSDYGKLLSEIRSPAANFLPLLTGEIPNWVKR